MDRQAVFSFEPAELFDGTESEASEPYDECPPESLTVLEEAHMCTYIDTSVYTYICVYVCVDVYIYIYICIHT